MSESLFERYKAALRRGHMAALAGELEDALAAYDAAAVLVPDRALPLASRGTVLHRLDRWPEAAEAFERALQLAPDDEATLRARATARAERDLRSGAAADFERLAFVLDVAGRGPLAADAARRAAELEPTQAREALAARLAAGVAQLPEAAPGPGGPSDGAATDQPRSSAREAGAYDALDALRAGLDPAQPVDADDGGAEPASDSLSVAPAEAAVAADESAVEPDEEAQVAADGGAWPGIDLPSPPPAPLEGPPPDPEHLIAEAALVLESGEIEAARDLLLTAARVHREAGRIDAALEVCLNLLSIAPGDPRVHLAIANLQLDRGWTSVATEKMALLVRLTALTGDTHAAADVHGLASERLRDDPAPTTAGR